VETSEGDWKIVNSPLLSKEVSLCRKVCRCGTPLLLSKIDNIISSRKTEIVSRLFKNTEIGFDNDVDIFCTYTPLFESLYDTRCAIKKRITKKKTVVVDTLPPERSDLFPLCDYYYQVPETLYEPVANTSTPPPFLEFELFLIGRNFSRTRFLSVYPFVYNMVHDIKVIAYWEKEQNLLENIETMSYFINRVASIKTVSELYLGVKK
jgi:hypothetical protein